MSKECLSCGREYALDLSSCPACGSREAIGGASTEEEIDRLFDGLDAQKDSAEHSHRGGEFFMQGDYGAARDEFLAAVQADPGSANDHENLGVTLCKLGQHADAIRYLERALELQPGKPTAGEFLAEARLEAAPDSGPTRQPGRIVELSIRGFDGFTNEHVQAVRRARAEGATVRVLLDVSGMMDEPELVDLVELVEEDICEMLRNHGMSTQPSPIKRVDWTEPEAASPPQNPPQNPPQKKWWQFWK